MKSLIVVPARYGSTRFSGKPLHMIAGKTLLERVVRVAQIAAKETGSALSVATDDQRIFEAAEALGVDVVMTDADLQSGTDRAYAAALAQKTQPEFVVNLQGDAPFTPPSFLSRMIAVARDTAADVVTPVMQLSWAELDRLREMKLTTPFSGTTCVMKPDGEAMWFSKIILPAMRKEAELREASPMSPVYKHIGLYGYRLGALERFAALPVSPMEALEGLEQLRFLENGMRVQTFSVEVPPISLSGIDTPQDAARAEALIAQKGEPAWLK